MRATRVLPVLLVLLVVASATVAQTPSASPSVTVTAQEPNGTVSREKTRGFTVTVKNTSPSTPLDDQNQGDVDIQVTGVPEGWTASATPANFQVRPGEAKDVMIQVSVAAGSSAQAADLTVTATMYSPLRQLDPLLGSVPGATQKSTASASLHLTVSDSLTRNVLEAVGPWIYVLLVLLVAAVLVAVAITVAARRTLVRLTSETRELTVAPGGKAVFPFRAEGLAKEPDSVLLQVSAVQEGWAAFLPVPELVLEPGQSQELNLVLIAPREALQGTRQAVLVTATSSKAPKGAANLEFVALVEGPEELPPAPRRRKE